jgi:hypothetical protein
MGAASGAVSTALRTTKGPGSSRPFLFFPDWLRGSVALITPFPLGRPARNERVTHRLVDLEDPLLPPLAVTEPPEEEPLDDLAQPLLGLSGGEQDGAGSLLQCVQCGSVASGSRRSSARL